MLPTILATIFLVLPAQALWPQPRALQTGSSALRLSPSFSIHISLDNAPSDLQSAVTRTESFLKNDKLERLVVGRAAADTAAIADARTLSSLSVSLSGHTSVKSITAEAQASLTSRDEAYELNIPSNGQAATLTANSTLGLLRGLTTFQQMWYWDDGTIYTLNTPVNVQDSPAFLNTLHWHVSDSQSFPLQVPGFMELSQKGAYSSSSVYSPSDIGSIVSYAGAEIDMPGHTSVISASHPEHVACAEATPWSSFAAEPPAGQLRLATPATITFTKGLVTAVAKMFPSTLFSTGGDEVNTPCYAQDAETQAALGASGQSLAQALTAFADTMHDALRGEGKTPVVWEEMVLDYNVTLKNDTVVMVWQSSQNAAAVAQKGYRFVHAASDYFYLDCGAGEWIGGDPSGNSWCDPFKTWQKAYTFDPLMNLTADQTELVLGGEHLLWTEQSSPANLDSIVWPRAAAGAEVFWSGAGGNGSSALTRLHDVAYRMAQRGVNAIKLQPEWCALRPGVCDLTA
ncbi:N-acetylhexosaminidase [Gloeopeniophorella convolvens]|nr:N-acetylhexosaminidase [Gloeopeniophorella convolvens]